MGKEEPKSLGTKILGTFRDFRQHQIMRELLVAAIPWIMVPTSPHLEEAGLGRKSAASMPRGSREMEGIRCAATN